MTSKNDILQYIDRLEQDLRTLRMMVLSMEETTKTKEGTDAFANAESETTPSVLMDVESPEELVAQFLVAAQQTDIEQRDAYLSRLLHSSILKHPPAVDSFLRFSFKTLQNRWRDYLADESDTHSFKVVRQQRNDRGELSDLRIYLEASHRSPCPITFQQDPMNEMQWRVVSTSL